MKKLLTFLVFCCFSFHLATAQNFCPNNLFVNGDLENGNPTCGHQDINQATGFSRIWQNNSFADYYPSTCTHPSLTQPLPSTGNWAGFWVYSRPDNGVTYREGIFNSLGTTLGPGNYSFTFDLACVAGYGTAELAVYGIHNPSNIPSNNNPTGNHAPLNEGFFGAANTYQLGTIVLDGNCNANKVNYTFNINTSSFVPFNGITHIMLTHSNQVIQPVDGGGLRYVAVDNFCLNLEDTTDPEICAEVIKDSITCNIDGTYTYTFDILNNSPNTVTSIEIYDAPANGAPIQLIRPVSIAPNGTYSTVTMTLPASAYPNYCFEVSLYADDADGEDALCCHIEHCIELPDCNPCDDVWVDNPTSLPDDDCCYSVDLHNNFGSGVFTKVSSRILTPGVTFKNPVAGGSWAVTGSGSSLDWTNGTHIPQGSYSAEVNFCLDGVTHVSQTPQVVVFDWYATLPDGTEEICSDTLTFDCTPCVLVEKDTLTCENGVYNFNLDMINTSGHTIDKIRYEVKMPLSGVCLDNTTSPIIQRPIGPINNGNPFSESLIINDCGAGLIPGSVIKLKVIVFDSTDPEWCCHLELELVVPPCDNEPLPCPEVQDYLVDCLDDLDGDGQAEYRLQLYVSGTGTVSVTSPCGIITPSSMPVSGTGGFYNFVIYNTGNCFPNFPIQFIVTDTNGKICDEGKWEIQLPECPKGCYCEDLEKDINAGFNFKFDCPFGAFTPISLTECDKVQWTVDGKDMGTSTGNIIHTVQFSGPGTYDICMIVIRQDSNGDLCEDKYCKTVSFDRWCANAPDPNGGGIDPVGGIIGSFPNPASDKLTLELKGINLPSQVNVSVLDLSGQRTLFNPSLSVDNGQVQLSVSGIQNGMYLVRIEGDNGYTGQTKFIKLKE